MNAVVREGIIEKITLSKDFRPLREQATWITAWVKGRRACQAEGSAVNTWGISQSLQSYFHLTLRQTAGSEKISPPPGRVEPLSISGETIFCWMDQASLSNQSGREYHSGPGANIHYQSNLLVLTRVRRTKLLVFTR